MKLPETFFSRILLAYLPFIMYPYDLFKAGVAALWVALFLWITATFFWLTRRLFPERSLKHAFFLWLIVWAQAAWILTKLPPYWIASVFFLTPVSFLDDAPKGKHVRVFSKEVPPPQDLSISAWRKLGPSKQPFWERKKKLGRYFLDRALSGIGFVGFVAAMVFVREITEKHLGMRVFQEPAGILLALAAFAFLWKNQPYYRRD